MNELTVIGVDPGPVPGFAVLYWTKNAEGWKPPGREGWCLKGADACQGSPNLIERLLESHISHATWPSEESSPELQAILAVERFIPSKLGNRRNAPGASTKTAAMAAALVAAYRGASGVWVVGYQASQVMPWASDRRLARIGLDLTGCTHARAALKHCLYASVRDGGMPDPLSKGFIRAAGPPAA